MTSTIAPSQTANKVAAPPLQARLAPWMQTVMNDYGRLREWIESYGSPLHTTVLSSFVNNIKELEAPLKERGVDGGLFFARKANKLPWFVKEAANNNIGIDTASLDEIEETLSFKIEGKDIVVTAIGKDKRIVTRSIESGCLLVIDNLDELELIESVSKELGKKARVGLRFSGFTTDYRIVFSRFGFPIGDAISLAQRVSKSEFLSLEIFHAHIDKYKTDERAQAAFEMIDIIDQLKQKDINIKGIDLGGGILISYLAKKAQWEAYLARLKSAVLKEEPSFNHQDDGLGFHLENGEVVGEMDLYPFYNDLAKGKFIESILETTRDDKPLYKEFAERNLKLFFEPGRALLDNVGMTLARVAFRKHDTEGNFLIGLQMNRMNLRPFRAEFCVDPYLVAGGKRDALEDAAYFVGCLCSESDLIYKRRLKLNMQPIQDDIYAFPNTAGYLAHHMEIGTHGNPLPTNLLLDPHSFEVLSTK